MEIAAGLAAVSQALGIAQAIRTIEKSYDAATYKAQIAELISALADAKLALSDAKEGQAERDKEIERLKASFEERKELALGPGDYKYFVNDKGQPLGYPVCPKCETKDGRIVQLKQDGGLIQGRCPVCMTSYRPVTAYLNQRERDLADAERQGNQDKLRELGDKLA